MSGHGGPQRSEPMGTLCFGMDMDGVDGRDGAKSSGLKGVYTYLLLLLRWERYPKSMSISDDAAHKVCLWPASIGWQGGDSVVYQSFSVGFGR